MKVIETPRTGKIGDKVAYISPFGQCYHGYCVPRDDRSEAKALMRGFFGYSSSLFGAKLTEVQRQHWCVAAETIPSHPSLGQYAHISGQQLCTKINSTLQLIGQEVTCEPPAPVIFTPNPVGDLTIVDDGQGGPRLLLSMGQVAEDIMLFGQPPCSAGRMKVRRVYYLGLVGPATNGLCEISSLYLTRFPHLRPGDKVFVVTSQEKNGWRGPDHITSATFPRT